MVEYLTGRGMPGSYKGVRVVELLGLPGVGKTTLAEALQKSGSQISSATPPDLWELKNAPFFLVHTLSSLGFLGRLRFGMTENRWLTVREIVWVAILSGWHRNLCSVASGGDRVLILDQGPVFLLTMLYLQRPSSLSDAGARAWWNKVSRCWADTLDLVIWLDAPDAILAQRIRAREKRHGLKYTTEEETVEHLKRFRDAQTRIVSLLKSSRSDLDTACFNTGAQSLDETVTDVLRTLTPK